MSEYKNINKFPIAITLYSIFVSTIGAFTLIYKNMNEPTFGFFIFFGIIGILDLIILSYYKLIRKIDFFSISLIFSYFLLTSSFIINTKWHFFDVFFLIPLFTIMNISLTSTSLREHFLIRYIIAGVYYVGGKFIALFDYISESIDSFKSSKGISINHFSDIIKTGLIFIVIGLPLILLIVSLLSSSSDQFSQMIGKLFSWDFDFGINFVRLIFVIVISLYLITDIYFIKALKKFEVSIEKSIDIQINNVKNILRAGILTVTILNIFYLFFIFTDLTSDFANARDLLLKKGVNSYSDFAVGRFWELIAISLINLGIFYFFTGFYKKLNSENSKILKPFIRGSFILLFINSIGLIASVNQRLSLYESGYGFTDKRLIAHLFIFILTAIFIISIVGLFTKEHSKLQLASLSILILFFSLYSALPTDYIINKTNYELAKAGKIAVYDPGYVVGEYVCSESEDAITSGKIYPSMAKYVETPDGLFVAQEIISEKKVRISPLQEKCLDQLITATVLKNKMDGQGDWRELNISKVLLQQYLSR